MITTKAILFFVSLFAAALFAFLETAFTSMRLFNIKQLSHKTNRFKRMFDVWEQNPRRILITILIAASFADVLASVLITDIFQSWLGDTGAALAMGVFIATVLMLIIGEIIPKSLASSHYESLLGSTLWLINFMFIIFTPISLALSRATTFFTKKDDSSGGVVTEKEIEFLIGYGDEKGVIESEKSEMLQNIFSLGQILAKEVMVPISDIVSVSINETIEKTMNLFTKHRFTRFPVYDGKEDNYVGIIHQKDIFDLLYRGEKKPLRELVIPVAFEPETKKINQLLSEFLKKRIHMAMIVNEYGEVIGLATLEDVIEEIVGEIVDEHETIHKEIVSLESGGWMVDASIDLEKVENLLNTKFEVADSITLGGFLAEKLQHLPKKGERLFYKGYCFQIQRTTSRRVQQVLIFEDS